MVDSARAHARELLRGASPAARSARARAAGVAGGCPLTLNEQLTALGSVGHSGPRQRPDGSLPARTPRARRFSPLRVRSDGGELIEAPIPEACPSPVALSRIDTSTGEVTTYAKDCDRKGCPYCGPKLRARYVAHYRRTFSELRDRGLRIFWTTLTVDPKAGVGPRESRRFAVDTLSRWRKRLKRLGELVYVIAPEEHKSGYTHLHALIALDSGVSPDSIRAEWWDLGGGAVATVEEISGARRLGGSAGEDRAFARCVGYCLKYAFKDAASKRGKGVRSLMVTAGYGYHAAREKEMRARKARESAEQPIREVVLEAPKLEAGIGEHGVADSARVGSVAPAPKVLAPEVWEGPKVARRQRTYSDVATPEDRKRWRQLLRENQEKLTRTYRTREDDVWVEYSYRRVNGEPVVERRVLDGPPPEVAAVHAFIFGEGDE